MDGPIMPFAHFYAKKELLKEFSLNSVLVVQNRSPR
jgi:hypothetical protein